MFRSATCLGEAGKTRQPTVYLVSKVGLSQKWSGDKNLNRPLFRSENETRLDKRSAASNRRVGKAALSLAPR